jgi:hypothetical protein
VGLTRDPLHNRTVAIGHSDCTVFRATFLLFLVGDIPMPAYIDRFVLSRDSKGKIYKGWRVTRYSFGRCTIQHLRTGASKTGVVDCFGNVIGADSYMISDYAREWETLVEFYQYPFKGA